MRCFLPPSDKKGMELHKCLKCKHLTLKHILTSDLLIMCAYNLVYHNVTMWLYLTDFKRTQYGYIYIYMLTLRSLKIKQKHSHKYVEVKYLPTTLQEGVYFDTMGVQSFGQTCAHSLGHIENITGYSYDDLISTLLCSVLHLIQEKRSVEYNGEISCNSTTEFFNFTLSKCEKNV